MVGQGAADRAGQGVPGPGMAGQTGLTKKKCECLRNKRRHGEARRESPVRHDKSRIGESRPLRQVEARQVVAWPEGMARQVGVWPS